MPRAGTHPRGEHVHRLPPIYDEALFAHPNVVKVVLSIRRGKFALFFAIAQYRFAREAAAPATGTQGIYGFTGRILPTFSSLDHNPVRSSRAEAAGVHCGR